MSRDSSTMQPKCPVIFGRVPVNLEAALLRGCPTAMSRFAPSLELPRRRGQSFAFALMRSAPQRRGAADAGGPQGP